MDDQIDATWSLEWNEEDRAEIESLSDLDQLLDRLDGEAPEHPIIVELFNPEGASMSLGLGRAVTVLNYVSATQDPPYFQSEGEASDEPLVFFYRGEWSEYPPSSAVPADAGRAALREFFETGELSSSVRWATV